MDADFLRALARPISGVGWRVVETQETAATVAITNSQADQSRLEELLEASKPPVPGDAADLSYLLSTPFRYPPLDYGSRFGSAFERGIFYASADLQTSFAESAVYLWLFRAALVDVGPLYEISDERSSYSIKLSTANGISLSHPEFDDIRANLVRPGRWSDSQALGSLLREVGVGALWYPSARIDGENVGVFELNVFDSKKESNLRAWHVHLNNDRCWFGAADRADSYEYHFAQFAENGTIPHPSM